MSNPRCSQGSGGDCFFRLVAASLLSIFLHLLVLGLSSGPALPPEADGQVRVLAVIGKTTGYSPSHPRASPKTIDDQRGREASRKNRREAGASPALPGENRISQASAFAENFQPAPAGMESSAYRLALGRAFGNLLGNDLRAALPAGELVFGIQHRASGAPPSLRLLGVADQMLSEQLLALMTQALDQTPVPATWRARDYRLELHAVIGDG